RFPALHRLTRCRAGATARWGYTRRRHDPILEEMVHAFPGYREVRRLHAGRRSTVDRVVRLHDERTVILKQPVADLIAAAMLGRIQHEFDLLRAVRGPGVIEALELLRDGNHAALVLEDFGTELAQ